MTCTGAQIAPLPDTALLTLAQEGTFCLSWLVVAALMRKESAAALCWTAYALLEGLAICNVACNQGQVGGVDAWSHALALASGCVAGLGGDFFINRRPRYLRFWAASLAIGIAVQFAAPFLPAPLAWNTLGYIAVLLVLLCAPLLLFSRPLIAEFGRPGVLALVPFVLFTAFVLVQGLRVALVPGLLERAARAHVEANASWLLPVILSSGAYHLTWIALVVGRQVRLAKRLARYDGLTGLLLRGAFESEMHRALAFARRQGQRLTVAFADVDRFKDFNDRGGHRMGDAILRQLAATLQDAARASDRVGRWGGEEFVLLLPDTDAEGARNFLDRLRQAIRGADIPVPEGCPPLSVSIGFATCIDGEADGDLLIARADAAMYAAKALGGDAAVAEAHCDVRRSAPRGSDLRPSQA